MYIVVGDVNDNDPVFHPVNYSVSVNENAPVGTPLVNVTATDADNFQNAQITYTVTSGDSGSVFTMETQVIAQHLPPISTYVILPCTAE